MSKQILIGVDIGTSNIKAVATDTSLKILAEYSEVTPFTHEKNFSEIDAHKLAQTVISVASKAAQDAGGVVAAIAFTGFSETGFLLDENGNPLAPGLAWHDPRGLTEPIVKELGDFEFRARAGAPVNEIISLSKTLWLNKEYPKTKSARYFLSAPEWVAYCLGAEMVNELSLVSRTGFFDVEARTPWLEAIALVGGGAINEGTLFDSMGTAEALLRTFKTSLPREAIAELAAANVGLSCSVIPNHYTLLGALPTGLTLERVCALVGVKTRAEKIALGEAALKVDSSTNTLQIVNDYHGLSVTNLDESASPAALFRAATEHLVKDSEQMVSLIEKFTGKSKEVIIAGGWIKNPMIASQKSKQFGEYKVSDAQEAGATGAAQFAGIAAGIIKLNQFKP